MGLCVRKLSLLAMMIAPHAAMSSFVAPTSSGSTCVPPVSQQASNRAISSLHWVVPASRHTTCWCQVLQSGIMKGRIGSYGDIYPNEVFLAGIGPVGSRVHLVSNLDYHVLLVRAPRLHTENEACFELLCCWSVGHTIRLEIVRIR